MLTELMLKFIFGNQLNSFIYVGARDFEARLEASAREGRVDPVIVHQVGQGRAEDLIAAKKREIEAREFSKETRTTAATEGEQRIVERLKGDLTTRERERQARIAFTLERMGRKVSVVNGNIITEEFGRKVVITPETYAKVPFSAEVYAKELDLIKRRKEEKRLRVKRDLEREEKRRRTLGERIKLSLFEKQAEIKLEERRARDIEEGVATITPEGFIIAPYSAQVFQKEIPILRQRKYRKEIREGIEAEELRKIQAKEKGYLVTDLSEKEKEYYERYYAIGAEPGVTERLKEVGIGVGLATYQAVKGGLQLIYAPSYEDVEPRIDIGQAKFLERTTEGSIIKEPAVQTFLMGAATPFLPKPLLTAGGIVVTGLTTKEYIEEPTPRKLGELIFYAGVTTLLITDLVRSRYKAQTSKLSPDKQKRLDEYLKLAQKVEAKSHRNLEPSKIEALRHVKNSKALNKALNEYFAKNKDIVSGGSFGQRSTLKGQAYKNARLPQDADMYIDMANKQKHTNAIMNIIKKFTDRKVYVKADGTIMVQNPYGESNAFSFHDLSKLKANIKRFNPIKAEFWKHYGVVETPGGSKVLNPKYQAKNKIFGAMIERYHIKDTALRNKKIIQDYRDFKSILDSSSITSTVYDRLGKRGAYYGQPIDYKPSGIPFMYSFLAPTKYPPTKYPRYAEPTPYPTFITPTKYPAAPTKYPRAAPYPKFITPVTPTYPKYAEPIYPKFMATVTVYPVAEEYPKVKYPAPKELPIFITPAKYPGEGQPPALITKVIEKKEKREPRFITPEKQEGYDVYLREGEKRSDRFREIAKNLPRNKALRKGARVTDEYLEATYRIRKSGRMTTELDIPNPPNLRKFRSPKPKSKLPRDSIIELAKHRLDSAKERQEISYFKELAARKKQLKKQIGFLKTEQKKKELKTKIIEQISFIKSSGSKQESGGISFISSSGKKKKKSKKIKFL